jgi:nickel/cobalt transporter (NicO) family protein
MKKLLLLYLFLFQNTLFGCAACQLMIPSAEINIDLNITQKTLKKMDISWSFSDMFTAELIRQYDDNKNDTLDKEELKLIKKALLDYLIPKNMVTEIDYLYNENDETPTLLKPKYSNFKLKLKVDRLVLSYDAKMDLPITEKSNLSFTFQDDEGFFGFLIAGVNIDLKELSYQKNIYLFTVSILFDKLQTKETLVPKEPKIIQKNTTIAQNTTSESLQSNILKESILKIKSLFESIKDEKNPLTYLMLLVFAYIYGVIHALGPGHGKTLVASYFLSNERSYYKALFISLAIGVVHTFSAFLLTVIIYFSVNSFLSQFLNDTVFYTTKISALIIISIAIYLLYKKYKAYKKLQEAQKKPQFSFSTTPHVATCSCASCKVDKDSTDAALIISAGIIPCPGTITIFIFSLSLGLYYAGFLSAIVMSLGMSTIIFFSAILSVTIRKKSLDTNSNLKKYLEYGSLIIILVLGLLLLMT